METSGLILGGRTILDTFWHFIVAGCPKANHSTCNNATLLCSWLHLPEVNTVIPMLASPKPKLLAKCAEASSF